MSIYIMTETSASKSTTKYFKSLARAIWTAEQAGYLLEMTTSDDWVYLKNGADSVTIYPGKMEDC